MTYNFPFFSNTYYRKPLNINYYPYNNRYSIPYYHNNDRKQNNSSNSKESSQTHKSMKKENEKKSEEPADAQLFEIFGIKLYFDDILLICLIFFLYNEGVKDQYLFISLILLLLT